MDREAHIYLHLFILAGPSKGKVLAGKHSSAKDSFHILEIKILQLIY